ncbi:transposase [Telmatospirillum sp.]|uniref:transposase n=1 Tax=Telmatospirillum sp. TaxID=2079197 RepID=UPI00386A31EA
MSQGFAARRHHRLLQKIGHAGKTRDSDLFRTPGTPLQTWQEEILRMFVFPYSNGITEGFHRKMKLIQRRAYGFRNFENYRLRVIVLCGHLPQLGL